MPISRLLLSQMYLTQDPTTNLLPSWQAHAWKKREENARIKTLIPKTIDVEGFWITKAWLLSKSSTSCNILCWACSVISFKIRSINKEVVPSDSESLPWSWSSRISASCLSLTEEYWQSKFGINLNTNQQLSFSFGVIIKKATTQNIEANVKIWQACHATSGLLEKS